MREELEAKLEAQEEKERTEEDDMPDDQREKREEQREQRRVEVLGKLEATGEQQEVPPLAAPTPPDESTGSGPTGDDAADADDDGDYDETEAEPQQEEAAAGSSVSSFFGFGDATPQVEPDPPAPPIAADAPSGSSFFGFFGGGDPEPPKAEEPRQFSQPGLRRPKFDVNTGEPIPAAPRVRCEHRRANSSGPEVRCEHRPAYSEVRCAHWETELVELVTPESENEPRPRARARARPRAPWATAASASHAHPKCPARCVRQSVTTDITRARSASLWRAPSDQARGTQHQTGL